jgi:rubredoxin
LEWLAGNVSSAAGVYDESKGWPDDGIAPGTPWEDVPEDFLCPDCGVGKQDFELIDGPRCARVIIRKRDIPRSAR